MNIVQTIRDETRDVGDKIAIVEGDRTIRYRDLLVEIDVLRRTIAERGIRRGHRIAFYCADGIDYVIGALALLECGAAVVPVADSVTPHEVQETMDRIDVHGVLVHAKMLRPPVETGAEQLDERFFWRPRHAIGEVDSRCSEVEAAFIRFSSGTTGESKGVVLSHRSIIERTDSANRGLQITSQDVILWVLGMSHHFVVSILLFLRKGATIIVANQSFPFSVLEAAQRFLISFIYASPVHYFLLAMSGAVERSTLQSVRLAISTSMKMPAEIFENFSGKFGIAPAEAYGIIEIGLPFINTDPRPTARSSVGYALPDYQVKISNPDSEGVGEVLIRGKGMFDAYFSPWRLRDECLDEGYFRTGDLGRVDEDGKLLLLGRSKTVIICAGMKVFPEEVEHVINSFTGVRESLVWGREHPTFGQVPVAHVVLNGNVSNPDDLLSNLRGFCCQELSSYNVPLEFRAVSSLVKTPSGKLARTPEAIRSAIA